MIRVLLLAAMVAFSHHADAQTPEQVDCSAFRRNPDGSWTVTKETRFMLGTNPVVIAQSTFRSGSGAGSVTINGIDLGAYIDRMCGGRVNRPSS